MKNFFLALRNTTFGRPNNWSTNKEQINQNKIIFNEKNHFLNHI